MASAIAALVVRTRPDLIHFQCGSESTANIVGDMLMVWASRICRAPVIFHLHVDPSTSGLPGRGQFGGWLFRQLMRPVHSILVLTEGYRDFLLTVCKLPQPVYVAPNMCDEQLLKIARQREHQPDVVRVVFLGRLTEAKGIFDLLAVAACLRSTGLRLCFEVAGLPSTDEEEAQLKEIVEREQLHDLVHFHGLVTSHDKLVLFENSHIVFIPSHGESFGIVAIEGMAAGLPVLATDVGGLRSIVLQNTTGYLVRPGDIEAMAISLAQLASDPQLRTQMGCAGRQRFVDRYSSTVVGKVIGAAYAHALEYA